MSTITDSPAFDADDLDPGTYADAPTDAALASLAASDPARADAPQLTPPDEDVTAGSDGGVTAVVWHRDVRITSMWSNASTRNAYAAVSGLGWRRISPANDSCFVTMTALLAHAEASGKRTDVQLDGNTIIEVYVF